MRIQTMSVVAGTESCDANCPYCVSKMTLRNPARLIKDLNVTALKKAIMLAKLGGVTTVLITGKGEPCLYPNEIIRYLAMLNDQFPFIEIQTNGIRLAENCINEPYGTWLDNWKTAGLTGVSISVAHYLREKNEEIFSPEIGYFDIEDLVRSIHSRGLIARVNCTMMRDYIDCREEVEHFIEWAKGIDIDQITLRPITLPSNISQASIAVLNWTKEHLLDKKVVENIHNHLLVRGNLLMKMPHGDLFDYNGQNVCMSDCLTISKNQDEVRQIIFYSNGKLMYDWQYEGAILMRGEK